MILATAFFPNWVNLVLAASALLTSFGVMWRIVIRPTARLIALGNQMMPLVVELVDSFHDVATPFPVLEEIIGQFRTDSGSSLRDVVDRLELSSKTAVDMLNLHKTDMESRLAAMTTQMTEIKDEVVLERHVAEAVASKLEALDARMAAQETTVKAIADQLTTPRRRSPAPRLGGES